MSKSFTRCKVVFVIFQRVLDIFILYPGLKNKNLGSKHDLMRIKLIYVLVAGMLLGHTSNAQESNNRIGGVITDVETKPVVGATVELLSASDSAIRRTNATNDAGKFNFRNLEDGVYLISITGVGYKRFVSTPVTVDSRHAHILLPAIVLQSARDKVMQEVVVVSKKPLVEHKVDRTIVNVDAMISAAGSSTLDVLSKAPGVTVDINGGVSLNGVGGVLILIDDKPTHLSVQDLAAYLRSLPAGLLDRVELMSNPPAKYDAGGNAIINIILKKNKAGGFNGSISLGYNQWNYARSNDALILNYRYKKVNVFGNVSYGRDMNFNNESFRRYYYNADGSLNTTILMNSRYTYESNSGMGRAGMDYYASSKTTLGVLFTGGIRPKTERRNYVSNEFDKNALLDSSGTGYINGDYDWKNWGANLNMQHKFNTEGKTLSFDLDYLKFNSNGHLHTPNYVYQPDGSLASENNMMYDLPSDINIYSAKGDYTTPLRKKGRFDAGFKSSFVNTDNSTNWFYEDGGIIAPDFSRSNHFIYKENINAAYISGTREWKRWSAQAGLRVENTQTEGHQLGNVVVPDSSFRKNYTSYFPSFYLSYKLDSAGNHTLKFSYGKRIRRPNYQQLNPFVSYVNKYSYTAGNPYLNPHFNNILELEYSYKHLFGVDLYYLHINNLISNLTQPNGNILINRPANFGVNYSFNIMTYVHFTPVKGWDLSATVIAYHLENKGDAFGTHIDRSITTGFFGINNQFKLNHGWSSELNLFYSGRQGGGQTFNDPMWRLTAAIQKNVFKDKGSIRLIADDIFAGMNYGDKTIIPGQSTAYHTNTTDTRRIGLAFNYRFGKSTNGRKSKHNDGGAEDENRRAN